MNTKDIKRKFEGIGASVKFGELLPRYPWQKVAINFTVDVKSRKKKEFFEILVNPAVKDSLEYSVPNLQKKDRHLILKVRKYEANNKKTSIPEDELFLCGHDERHLFVAALSGFPSSVHDAKESLKPEGVIESQKVHRVTFKDRNKRKNNGFMRQGEWFFIPCPDLAPNEILILRDEPLRRGRGKPHMAEFLYRRGGDTVYVSKEYPNGLTEAKKREFQKKNPNRKINFSTMARNSEAYVRGRISHTDHKTINLPFWHRVATNNEAASQNMAFLD